MRKNKGFTLIELMIVVAIIAIIAAIAIPGLLRARIASNETSAIGTMRTMATSQTQYKEAMRTLTPAGQPSFGTMLQLTDAASGSPYLTTSLAPTAGVSRKSGYAFVINIGAVEMAAAYWNASAVAITQGSTGVRSFGVDVQAEVFARPAGDANTVIATYNTANPTLLGTAAAAGWTPAGN